MEVLLRRYFWVFSLAIVSVCALLLAKAVSLILGAAMLRTDEIPHTVLPLPGGIGLQESKRNIESMLERNIFCSSCEPLSITPIIDPQKTAPGPVDSQPQKTTMPLQLVALMPSEDSEWSFAIIRDNADEKKPCDPYKRGTSIASGKGTVLQVTDKRVYILIGSRIEYLDDSPPIQMTSPPPMSPIPMIAMHDISPFEKEFDKGIRCSGPNSCEIDRSLVDKVLSNTASLISAARISPAPGPDGRPMGIKITPVGMSSIWSKLGIQPGDIVKSINGLDMVSPDKMLEIYAKLKNASHLSLAVQRRGEPMSIDYTIR